MREVEAIIAADASSPRSSIEQLTGSYTAPQESTLKAARDDWLNEVKRIHETRHADQIQRRGGAGSWWISSAADARGPGLVSAMAADLTRHLKKKRANVSASTANDFRKRPFDILQSGTLHRLKNIERSFSEVVGRRGGHIGALLAQQPG